MNTDEQKTFNAYDVQHIKLLLLNVRRNIENYNNNRITYIYYFVIPSEVLMYNCMWTHKKVMVFNVLKV